MELVKIIAKCENSEDFKDRNIDELADNYKVIVKGKDNFMSGWGMAKDVNAYSLVLCENTTQAHKMMEGMKKDSFNYVNYYYINSFKAIDNKNIYTLRLASECRLWLK